jgi:DNA-directed RNA polymerase subunit D
MKLEVLKKTDRKLSFILEETDYGFVNALRRVMMNEVPTLSIEFVDFVENSSGVYDEIVAHRLGMIPLTFKPNSLNLKEECRCKGKGCSNCEVMLTLEKVGPAIVKASDLVSDEKSVQPLDKEIPVVELLEGQKIKFTAVAQLGFGREHSKWQAAIVGYRNVPIVKVNENATSEIVDVCPTDVFEKKDGKIKVVREQDCILCMRCTEVNEEGVKVSAREEDFIFSVESVSGLTAAEILNESLDILEEKANDFITSTKKELK